MAASIDPKRAWIASFLGSTVSGKAFAAASAGKGVQLDQNDTSDAVAEADKLQNQLAHILLAIGDYAEGPEQEQDWLTRATKAQDLVDEENTTAARAIIELLGKEMAAAAGRARAAYAPFAQWQKAYDKSLNDADGLKAAMIAEINGSGEGGGIINDFESGWTILQEELDGVGEVMQKALAKACKASSEARGMIVGKAVASAIKLIDSSELLSDIDDNDVKTVNIVRTLRQELNALQRATGA